MADIRKRIVRRDIKTADKWMLASSRIRHGVSSARRAAEKDKEEFSDGSPNTAAAERYLKGIRSSHIAAGKAAGRAYRDAGEVYAVYRQRRGQQIGRDRASGIRKEDPIRRDEYPGSQSAYRSRQSADWPGNRLSDDRTGRREGIQQAQKDPAVRKHKIRGHAGRQNPSRHAEPEGSSEYMSGTFWKENITAESPGTGRVILGGKGIRRSFTASMSGPEGTAYLAGRNLLIRKYAKETLTVRNGARQKMIFTGEKISQKVKRVFHRVQKGMTAAKTLLTLLTAGASFFVTVILICILFGADFYMFGDTSASSITPVSAEVEEYESLIRQYTQQYGIGEYVQLIKAIMMQESTGLGTDPMMASESGYNKKYPHSPGAITDPAYSIQCGVQTIRDALERAGVENPVDMEHIRLALQGYNFGNGYVEWAIKRDGGYTVENAAAFSDMMAKRMGWEGYGDKNYVSNVLRFYPYGRYNYGIGNSVITQVAAAQVGNHGGQPYWSWYGYNSRVDWCAIFVSWCGGQCGYIDSGILPKFAVVSDGISFFKERGQWQPGTYTPAPGDIIFFNWDGDSVVDHVGIVESFDGTYVHTIEGNSSDACQRQDYLLGEACIVGYGVPKY